MTEIQMYARAGAIGLRHLLTNPDVCDMLDAAEAAADYRLPWPGSKVMRQRGQRTDFASLG